MKVAIASRNRAGEIYPLKWLSTTPYIFVEPQEEIKYRQAHRGIPVINIGQSNQGLTFARNFILDYFDEPILMLDDDVDSIAIRKEDGKLLAGEHGFLEYLEKTLLENELTQLGVSFRPSNWLCEKELKYFDRAWACRAINIPKLKQKGLKINEQISKYGFFEDFLLALQMHKAGLLFATTYKYAFACKGVMGENVGGQKDFRTSQLSVEEAMRIRHAFGPNLVKIVLNKKHGNHEVQVLWSNMRKGV